MKYKKDKFSEFLKNGNDLVGGDVEKEEKDGVDEVVGGGFKENFAAAKKNHKNGKIKYGGKSRKKFWIKIAIITFLIVGLITAVLAYLFSGFKMDGGFDKSNSALGLTSKYKINNKVTNIALFGVDKRSDEKRGRSDAIMIATFDGVHKAIKIASILRDTRLPIDGHGQDKLGHAFSYGGANLAVKTLNKNFKLDMRDYVALNFGQMIHIINAFGGIDVKISRDQAIQINGIINSTPEYRKSPRLPVFKEPCKLVHLNGAQTLSYARMRKHDDEHHRATRQQIVMNLLLEKAVKMPAIEYPKLFKRLLPYMETSLGFQEILGFVPFLVNGRPVLKREIIPHRNDPTVQSGLINGTWYWSYDVKKYAKVLHKFIYED